MIFSFLLACCLPSSEVPDVSTTPTPEVPTPEVPPALPALTAAILEKDVLYEGTLHTEGQKTTIHYVTVVGPNAEAINKLLSPEAATGGEMKPAEYDAWDARIVYNADGVLQVAYDVEYMGAYPSSSTYHLAIDATKGTPITIADAFGADTSGLRGKIDAELAKLRAGHEADIKREIPDVAADDSLMTSLVDAHIDESELATFELGDAGISFEHDYGTPHVALALLPPDRVALPWAVVGPLVNANGPLAAAAKAHH